MPSSKVQSFLNRKLQECGLSKKELAEKAQIAAPILSNISNGYKVNIELKTLCKLAAVFNCSVDEVCGREEFITSQTTATLSQTNDITMLHLKSFLKERMRSDGMTTSELEKGAHLSLGSISSFVGDNATKQSLGSAIVVGVADYFKVSIDEMIGRTAPARMSEQTLDVSGALLAESTRIKKDTSAALSALSSQDLTDVQSIRETLRSEALIAKTSPVRAKGVSASKSTTKVLEGTSTTSSRTR